MDRIAVNKRTALLMFWNAGFNTEARLIQANEALTALAQPTAGYFYADDVAQAITNFKG